MKKVNPKEYPVIISFFAGDKYYYDAGKKLVEDCERIGLDHHIVEVKFDDEMEWIDLCRYKIKFVQESVKKFNRPVFWMDVDCRINSAPEVLRNNHHDIGFFLRGFKYLRGFDPKAYSRMIHPAFVYYNNTDASKSFVELMGRLEQNSTEKATDDYYLQEAWLGHEDKLNVSIFSPSMLSFEHPAPKGQPLYFGASGSVDKFKGEAKQHKGELFSSDRMYKMLIKEARVARSEGKKKESITLMKRALRYTPGDYFLAQKIARQMISRTGARKAYRFLKGYSEENSSERDVYTRFKIDNLMLGYKTDKAIDAAKKLRENGTSEDKLWVDSRMVRLEMDQRAKKAGYKIKDRTPVWWMETPFPGNFGDILNPYIIEKLSGIPPRFTNKSNNSVLAIGSIIKFAHKGSTVWGVGTPRMTDKLNPEADYRAVRGPLSRQLVQESGGVCPEVYGDPAVFLPKIYMPKNIKKKYKIGLIKHYTNEEDLSSSEGVREISVIRAGYQGIEQFIDELMSCEKVLTTSLHGLIVAHAYGIPAEWLKVDNPERAIPGDGTKYHDYMLSVGIKPKEPIEVASGTVIDKSWAKKIKTLPKKEINLKKLADAAPFDVVIDL